MPSNILHEDFPFDPDSEEFRAWMDPVNGRLTGVIQSIQDARERHTLLAAYTLSQQPGRRTGAPQNTSQARSMSFEARTEYYGGVLIKNMHGPIAPMYADLIRTALIGNGTNSRFIVWNFESASIPKESHVWAEKMLHDACYFLHEQGIAVFVACLHDERIRVPCARFPTVIEAVANAMQEHPPLA